MNVKELMEKLSKMPPDAPVYAEGEEADKVIYERSPDGAGGIVRIFKAWNVEFVSSADVFAEVFAEVKVL